MTIHNDLKETFWNNHKAIKRKTTVSGELEAKKEQLYFCSSKLSKEDLQDTFGDYTDYVKRWINAELVCNKYGKHLYVKLGD